MACKKLACLLQSHGLRSDTVGIRFRCLIRSHVKLPSVGFLRERTWICNDVCTTNGPVDSAEIAC